MISFPLLLAFLAGFLAVLAVNFQLADLDARRRTAIRDQLEDEIRHEQRERARLGMEHLPASKSKDELEMLSLSPATMRERLEFFLAQAGVSLKPTQLILLSLFAAVAVVITLGIVLQRWLPAAALTPIAAYLPWLIISIKRRRRLDRLQGQLADVFDMMARILRSGQTISQALQAVADEFPRPAAEEFGYCFEQQNLGLSPAIALRELTRRTGLLELKIFVLAVAVHRQTGGNLAELLDKLAAIIRDRYRIKGMIKSMTAEGRFQAIILLALPPLLLAGVTVINNSYAMILFRYPALILGMFGLMSVGAVWMYRIIHFDF